MQITAEASKVTKSVLEDLTFIFIKLSGTANSFVKIRLMLEVKNIASFIKARLYSKRGCIKMRKHVKMFCAGKGYKLAYVVFLSLKHCLSYGIGQVATLLVRWAIFKVYYVCFQRMSKSMLSFIVVMGRYLRNPIPHSLKIAE